MFCYYEIEMVWCNVIMFELSGRKIVIIGRFVQELEKVNYYWSLCEVNRWIEWYVIMFRDILMQEGENCIFQLFNFNGGF